MIFGFRMMEKVMFVLPSLILCNEKKKGKNKKGLREGNTEGRFGFKILFVFPSLILCNERRKRSD